MIIVIIFGGMVCATKRASAEVKDRDVTTLGSSERKAAHVIGRGKTAGEARTDRQRG